MPDSSVGKESGYLDDLLKPAPDAPADDKPNPAESSPAEGEKPADPPAADAKAVEPAKVEKAEPKSALDAITQALGKEKAQEQATGSKATKDQPAETPADADKAKADEWDGKSPLHEHPRFKEVIAERNAFKEKAQTFDQFMGGLAETGLNVKEFNDLLGVGALIKRDPAKALEAIEAYADQLRGIVGEKLAPALKKRVDDGEISEADARELSRAQARAAMTEQRATQTAEEAAQIRIQNHLKDCRSTVQTWMTQQAQLDPDWPKKQQLVLAEAENLEAKYGTPPTVQDAKKLMDAAKKRVEDSLRAFVPAKPKVEPPVKAGVASTSTAPVPKSPMEALELGLRAARAA